MSVMSNKDVNLRKSVHFEFEFLFIHMLVVFETTSACFTPYVTQHAQNVHMHFERISGGGDIFLFLSFRHNQQEKPGGKKKEVP